MAKAAVATSNPRSSQAIEPAVTPQPLSPFQLEAAHDERERLLMRLDNARQAMHRRNDELLEVVRREETATRFLNISSGHPGFESRRRRAQELTEHCAARRQEIEPRVENSRLAVKELEEKLSRIPVAAIDRQCELEELGRQLSAPLP
jgi:hypothetical protein